MSEVLTREDFLQYLLGATYYRDNSSGDKVKAHDEAQREKLENALANHRDVVRRKRVKDRVTKQLLEASQARERALMDALMPVLEHIEELEEAWSRGVFTEHDTIGRGGTRSNRNVTCRVLLRKALQEGRCECGHTLMETHQTPGAECSRCSDCNTFHLSQEGN